jgi:tetratricopeptide (TPR) repeat protein
LIAELFTLAACLVVILSLRQWPALAAVWAAYVVILLPVVGIIHNGPQLVADRYTYLSCLGWAVLAGAAAAAMWGTRGEWGARLRRASTGALVASVVTTLGFLTWGQVQVWRDSEALWTQALSASPSAQAHNHLGVTFALDGRRDEAVWQFMEALRMWPAFPEAHISLGAVLASEGRLPEAVAHYEIALRINPRLAKAHNNMGEALAGQGSPEVAIEHFRRALVIDPGFTEAQRNLDRVLRGQGLSSSSR